MSDREDEVRKAVLKSTVKDEKIKIAANDPSLRGKIRVDIKDMSQGVYWYIKFNIPLDPASVSKHTMKVTETNGYILNSIFTYTEVDNMIVISPIDPYLPNEFYILTVTTDVRSAKGNNLKKEIHVLFKLIENKVTEFQILKSTVKVPEPRVKPESEKRKTAEAVAKYYSFTNEVKNKVKPDRLPFADMRINVLLGILGLALVLASLYIDWFIFTVISSVLCATGILHIIVQLLKKELQASILYNLGVMNFNRGKYKKADKRFKSSARLDPNNEYTEYALNKVTFYL